MFRKDIAPPYSRPKSKPNKSPTAGFCFAYSSVLNMDVVIISFEMSVEFYRTTQRYDPEIAVAKEIYKQKYLLYLWVRGSVVVKALCYKPEGRGFNSRLDFSN
jgi:hypothetical protein